MPIIWALTLRSSFATFKYETRLGYKQLSQTSTRPHSCCKGFLRPCSLFKADPKSLGPRLCTFTILDACFKWPDPLNSHLPLNPTLPSKPSDPLIARTEGCCSSFLPPCQLLKFKRDTLMFQWSCLFFFTKCVCLGIILRKPSLQCGFNCPL